MDDPRFRSSKKTSYFTLYLFKRLRLHLQCPQKVVSYYQRSLDRTVGELLSSIRRLRDTHTVPCLLSNSSTLNTTLTGHKSLNQVKEQKSCGFLLLLVKRISHKYFLSEFIYFCFFLRLARHLIRGIFLNIITLILFQSTFLSRTNSFLNQSR